MKILVTGGAGFIGSNYVKRLLLKGNNRVSRVVVLDKLTYAGSLDNLNELQHDSRLEFVQGDICDRKIVAQLFRGVDAVVHFAAESHVDRSIESSLEFVKTNVLGTANLLENLRDNPKVRFLHVSTDEVYGSILTGNWDETAPLKPNSPYAASKASSDLIAISYFKTYGLDIIVSRCCNNYGPNQYPEKVIPLFITNILSGKKIPLYGSGLNIREWIHVNDHCDAINLILKSGKSGEVYNVGSGYELSNLELSQRILERFGKSIESIVHVEDRPGHDFRYSLDCRKIRNELNFNCNASFEDSLIETIDWYRENTPWWETRTT